MPKAVDFFSEVIDQLKVVTWPDKKTLVRLTTVVLLVSVVVALYLGGLDLILTRLIGVLVK